MLATLILYRRAMLRWVLIDAVQRAWRRHQVIVPLYRHLATLAPDEQREIVLLLMAEHEVRHQQQYARMLARLHAPLPASFDSFDRIWLWLLPRCSPTIALRWTAWTEQRDARAILEAMALLRI
ncbi:hypothetical protein [Roseiflexus sp.]|uniref:hypothetical protein n=1 Tax=Roseiflexus sp. TaxID=2562120 RepID=UPI0021DBF951|nr:hypothetical protein [Roseiflexus sp.]GIV82928.1 MAG: hypothetical protein KatS3mg051_2282 [Anaerolineae bacterium]GIV99004.1 MAG: hypothetical protein KatS3mg058_0408 [Roseiflexus sp.]